MEVRQPVIFVEKVRVAVWEWTTDRRWGDRLAGRVLTDKTGLAGAVLTSSTASEGAQDQVGF